MVKVLAQLAEMCVLSPTWFHFFSVSDVKRKFNSYKEITCIKVSHVYNICVTLLGDAGWIGGLTKVMIYLVCANQH